MERNNPKGWLYLLPAFLFLGVFMIYPLVDVFIYSFEEGFNFASQTSMGSGTYNYQYVLHDPYFLQAIKNRQEPLAGINSAIHSLEMIIGIYQSAINHMPAALPLKDRRHPLS